MPVSSINYYDLLQINPRAEVETIERVYRIMAARYRPDNKQSGDAQRFRVLNEAYPVKGHHYWSLAIRILRSMCEYHLAKKDKKWEGILRGGVYHLPKELGVDESVIWGEYFFVEALEQALQQLG
jgi:hypothetical protein